MLCHKKYLSILEERNIKPLKEWAKEEKEEIHTREGEGG